ncbi:hypothetical protein HMI55_003985 [Coelomomyces lativittatus]|nr:hypothetical protein HMI55_003985 [Coelomomyces lativittatus]
MTQLVNPTVVLKEKDDPFMSIIINTQKILQQYNYMIPHQSSILNTSMNEKTKVNQKSTVENLKRKSKNQKSKKSYSKLPSHSHSTSRNTKKRAHYFKSRSKSTKKLNL